MSKAKIVLGGGDGMMPTPTPDVAHSVENTVEELEALLRQHAINTTNLVEERNSLLTALRAAQEENAAQARRLSEVEQERDTRRDNLYARITDLEAERDELLDRCAEQSSGGELLRNPQELDAVRYLERVYVAARTVLQTSDGCFEVSPEALSTLEEVVNGPALRVENAELRSENAAQAQRIAELEAAYKHVKNCLHIFQDRVQRSEERIQELEEQND